MICQLLDEKFAAAALGSEFSKNGGVVIQLPAIFTTELVVNKCYEEESPKPKEEYTINSSRRLTPIRTAKPEGAQGRPLPICPYAFPAKEVHTLQESENGIVDFMDKFSTIWDELLIGRKRLVLRKRPSEPMRMRCLLF